MTDGSITFSTQLDNAQLEKELNALTKKIEKKERDIADLQIKRDQALQKGALGAAALDEEKAKLDELRVKLEKLKALSKDKSLSRGDRENYAAQLPFLQQEWADQQARVRGLQAEYNKIDAAAERYAARLSDSENALSRQKEEAGYLTQQLEEAEKAAGGMSRMVERTEKRMGHLNKRIQNLASRVFVFTLITTALRSMRTWLGNIVKTNDEAAAAIARLKGALLTLAQPLVEVIIPAFTMLVSILARAVAAIANLVSILFGKTLKQSKDGAAALWKEANAIEGVGAAAEEAAGSLAGFDEINAINTEPNKGAGGAAAADDIAPDFSWMDGMDGMSDRLQKIADLVAMIAAGLALWKIGDMLPGVLGDILKILGGILITLGGILLFFDGLADAWENGIDWFNLLEMLAGLAAAVLGLYTLFGKVGAGIGLLVGGIAMFITGLHDIWENGVNWPNLIATVAGFAAAVAGLYILFGPIVGGIGAVVGGIAMLVTAFHDAMENGWNLQNTLLAIAGIVGTGLGLTFLTGSIFPLIIAGIAAVLLAFTVATGHGEELLDGIRTMIEGFSEFFTGIFSGDIEKAIGGIVKIFDGLGISVNAVIDGLQDAIFRFLDWLDEKTGGRFHGIIETAKGFVTAFFEGTKETIGEWLAAIQQIFTGLVQFLTGVFTGNWDLAWEGIQNIFKGAWNSIIGVLEGAVNLIIKGLNWLISQMNEIHFEVPSWVPGIGGKELDVNIPSLPEKKIPRLAQGAVIPPNREFMAVLGDQKSGNNIEAPEGLIRQIFREESNNAEVIAILQSLLEAVRAGQVIMVDGATFGRTAIRTINNANTAAGKQLLKI